MQQHGFPKARMLQHKLINAQTPAAEWRNSLAQRVALGKPNKKQKPASAATATPSTTRNACLTPMMQTNYSTPPPRSGAQKSRPATSQTSPCPELPFQTPP